MNSLVSLISGQFTRSLIFGAFLPIVLFLALGLLSVQPFLPEGMHLAESLQQLETQWRILVITFVAVVMTVFMYYLNTPIIRLLEGYPWEHSALGRKLKDAQIARYNDVETLLPRLRFLRVQWSALNEHHPRVSEIQQHMNVLGLVRSLEFPSKPNLILPTRFGNVLRSFETYSLRQYGIDAIVFWPRIVTVADKETLGIVEDARSSVDFFVNCSVLSALLAAILFILGGITITSATPWTTVGWWMLETSATALASMIFYFRSISGVAVWGDQVKAIFDLFRGDLLKKMGYQQTPLSKAEERNLWTAVTKQVLFGDSATAPPLPYAFQTARTAIEADPRVELETLSGVTKQPHGIRVYTYRIINRDSSRTTNIVLTETLPEGQVYLWDSARKGAAACPVIGTNPYTVTLGPVLPNSSIEFSYSAADIRK